MSNYEPDTAWANEATEQAFYALLRTDRVPAETIARLTYLDAEEGKIDRVTDNPLTDIFVLEFAERLEAAYAGRFADGPPGEIDWAEIAELLTCDDWASCLDDEIRERGIDRVRAEMTADLPTVRELRRWLYHFPDQDKPIDLTGLMTWINSSMETRMNVKPI